MDYLISEIDKPKQTKQNKRQKIMMFLNKWGWLIVLSIYVYFTFLSPFHTRDNASFSLKDEVVKIPLSITNHQRYHSYVVIKNNSVRMLIDTGMSGSQLCCSVPTTYTLIRRTKTVDGGGFTRRVPIRRVREMYWGGLKIENLLVSQDRGMSWNIIGDRILRHFAVQFDNENREIVLTQNPALIEKRGIRVPFSRGGGNNAVVVTLSLNGKEGDFLLDTGYPGELRVGSDFFYSSGFYNLENVKWKNIGRSLFMPESLRRQVVANTTPTRLELGERMFENVIVSHCTSWQVNVIGVAFLQRFRTFTIDYLNGYIYFELPENNSFVSFSDNPIEAIPVASLGFVFNSINAFGVRIPRSHPYTVRRLQKNSIFAEKGIEVGDTLVGINQLIFNTTVFDKLNSERDSFHLETNRSRQRTAINDVFFRANKATFHFLKNGELISIEKMRDNILYPPPAFAYSFDNTPSPFALHTIPVKPNFYLQIVPSTLVGREKYFTVFRDGKEIVISNNPDAPNPLLDNEN